MPVTINEVHSEVHVLDASALLDEELLRVITRRVIDELRRMEVAERRRAKDSAIPSGRRGED